MAIIKVSPLVVVLCCGLCFCLFSVVNSIYIPDLRRTRNNGTHGRFVVPRPFLEDELARLGVNENVRPLSSSWYNSEYEGEVSFFVQSTVDFTLRQELPPRLLSDVTTDGTFAALALPVVASDGSHATIMTASFSDASSRFVSSYMTSVPAVRYIDSIDIGEDYVTLRHGCDEMHVTAEHEDSCHDDTDVGEDFDHVIGNDTRLSNFPARFDWGCDVLGSEVCFCRRLGAFAGAIEEANGDVCTKMSITKSRRCSANMRVERMTGIFRDAMPFLADLVPVQSFETEYVERDHGMGIVFPCF